MVKVDLGGCSSFVKDAEYKEYVGKALEAFDVLEDETGAGNDFLGWKHLPTTTPESLIAECEAVRDSWKGKGVDLVVVIGIGGSYLGAKCALEALSHSFAKQLAVTGNLLEELGATGKPTLFVFNKCDRIHDDGRMAEMRQIAKDSGGEFVFVSAQAGAGLDTLEHGDYLERDTLDMLAESRTIWVPTLAPTGNLLGCGRYPDEQVEQILRRQMKCVRYVFDRGGRLGLGSDAGAYLVPHGQGLLDEYALMKQAVGPERVPELNERLRESESWIKKEMKRG